jgi:hypothetical protein
VTKIFRIDHFLGKEPAQNILAGVARPEAAGQLRHVAGWRE